MIPDTFERFCPHTARRIAGDDCSTRPKPMLDGEKNGLRTSPAATGISTAKSSFVVRYSISTPLDEPGSDTITCIATVKSTLPPDSPASNGPCGGGESAGGVGNAVAGAAPCCPPEEDCCDCDDQCSQKAVRFVNGEVQISVTYLFGAGFGAPWRHRRTYSNQLSTSTDLGNGVNWIVESWPYLIEKSDGSIVMVRGLHSSLWFDLAGGDYVARYGAATTLEHDAANDRFVLTQPGGRQWVFHDFDQTDSPQGLFASMTTPGGEVTEVTSYNRGPADRGDPAELDLGGRHDDRVVPLHLRRTGPVHDRSPPTPSQRRELGIGSPCPLRVLRLDRLVRRRRRPEAGPDPSSRRWLLGRHGRSLLPLLQSRRVRRVRPWPEIRRWPRSL